MKNYRFCLLCLIGLLFLPLSPVWAWDGEWTKANSGRGDIFDDPERSQGKAGTDPPQKFYTPNPRDFADVDPEELDDYFNRYKKEYAPYALARIFQDLRYNNLVIPKGYYHVKPGDIHDGSPNVNMKTLNPIPVEQAIPVSRQAAQAPSVADADQPAILDQNIGPKSTGQSTKPVLPQTKPLSNPNGPPPPQVNTSKPIYRVFVLKKQGKVAAVVPIHRMETYKPPRKEKIPKHALAWVEIEDHHPVLKFYYKKQVYCTDFQ
jgi:hypothetical protein